MEPDRKVKLDPSEVCGRADSRADEDIVPIEADLVPLEPGGRVDRVRSRPHIVLPSVHRTGDNGAIEFPLAHGPTAVQAHVGNRKESSVHVEQGDRIALDDHDPATPRRDLSCLRDADEHGHPIR